MNTKLIPEAAQTSFSTALKLNAWAAMALLFAALGRWYAQKGTLHPAIRGGLLLLPLIPSALYAHAIAQWIRRLDELQRRIQQEAWCFATTGTIFVLTGLNQIETSGLLGGTRLAQGLGWEGTYALALVLWVAGSLISNRRYQ